MLKNCKIIEILITYKMGKLDKNRKYNIESLRNESTKFLYQQRLTNKLNQNEFADTEKSVFMKQQRKHWEKRRSTKEGKQCFGMLR